MDILIQRERIEEATNLTIPHRLEVMQAWAEDAAKEIQRLRRMEEQIERLTNERDAWQRQVGSICAAIPLPDAIAATGTLGDLIAYLKENLPRTNQKASK